MNLFGGLRILDTPWTKEWQARALAGCSAVAILTPGQRHGRAWQQPGYVVSHMVRPPDVVARPAHCILARAYNDWIDDYCSTDRHRLFPCGIVPLQTVEGSIGGLRRVAKPTSRWAGLGREASHIPPTQPNPVRAANDGTPALTDRS